MAFGNDGFDDIGFPTAEFFYENDFHSDQLLRLREEQLKCEISFNEGQQNSSFCPSVWDGAYCWPETPPGTLAEVYCPAYIHGFNVTALASRQCMLDGTWWWNEEVNRTWTNYTLCEDSLKDFVGITSSLQYFFQVHLQIIKIISDVGYSLSLLMLLAAFAVLAFIKKLRCPRNSLHMQLFLSFIMRALLSLMRVAFTDVISSSGDVQHVKALITNDKILCKVYVTFWQYFLMANYCWILMEGLYLHNLIFMSMFTDASGIFKYVIFGWGFPVFFIVPWMIVKVLLENKLCWTVNENPAFFWIIRGPITASIIINFVFFINITRVLFLKMFSSQAVQTRQYRYRKWFKSTLVLVPLFGVHYALLLSISFAASVSATVELSWLYIDQTFSSFQGSFVALLYCFLNGEVKSEIKKMFRVFRSSSERGAAHHASLLTQSLTYISRARNSIQSLHSAAGDQRGSCNLSTIQTTKVMGLSSMDYPSPHPSPKIVDATALSVSKWASTPSCATETNNLTESGKTHSREESKL